MTESIETGLIVGIIWGHGVIVAHDAQTGKRAVPPVITLLLAFAFYGVVPTFALSLALSDVNLGYLSIREFILSGLGFFGGAGIGGVLGLLTRPRPRNDSSSSGDES